MRTARNGNFAKGPALRQLYTKNIRSPASWGKDKAKVAVKECETITGLKVQEHELQVGLNSHFLAASPDGKTEDGVLVEVKRPYSISDVMNNPIEVFFFFFLKKKAVPKMNCLLVTT